ncbi:MAG: zinc ABC transporter substrate-binding protein [Candidatus Bathyarchaeota archaeon]
MEKKTFTILATVLAIAILAGSIGTYAFLQAGQQPNEEKIGVIVTIPPQAEFVEEVGGEKVQITVMVPQGANPHTYEPSYSKMEALSKAEIYAAVGSGIEFELAWMDKLTAINDNMLLVDCSKEIELIPITQDNENTFEVNGEQGQGAMDPHIWLSPRNAKIMVENIYNGLVQIDPVNREYYAQNKDNYLKSLDALDAEIGNSLAEIENKKLMFYHPAWGYFANDYNLKSIAVEEEGKEPTAKGIISLIDEAEKYNIKVIFASPQFNVKSAEVISNEIDGRIVFVDPLAKDYVSNLRVVAGEITKGLE